MSYSREREFRNTIKALREYLIRAADYRKENGNGGGMADTYTDERIETARRDLARWEAEDDDICDESN